MKKRFICNCILIIVGNDHIAFSLCNRRNYEQLLKYRCGTDKLKNEIRHTEYIQVWIYFSFSFNTYNQESEIPIPVIKLFRHSKNSTQKQSRPNNKTDKTMREDRLIQENQGHRDKETHVIF